MAFLVVICLMIIIYSHKWYQAVGIISLLMIAGVLDAVGWLKFDAWSCCVGYILCILEHLNISVSEVEDNKSERKKEAEVNGPEEE